MKKSTKNKAIKIPKKVFIILLLLFYWSWLLYSTQPATDNNTYGHKIFIEDIEVNYAYHRGNDRINITTADNSYVLFTNWRNEKKTDTFVENLLLENDKVSITVWKHTPTTIRSLIKNGINVFQIVDIRTKNNIYFDVSDFNSNQKIERICGVIAGVLLTLVVLIFNNLELTYKLLGKFKLKNKK